MITYYLERNKPSSTRLNSLVEPKPMAESAKQPQGKIAKATASGKAAKLSKVSSSQLTFDRLREREAERKTQPATEAEEPQLLSQDSEIGNVKWQQPALISLVPLADQPAPVIAASPLPHDLLSGELAVPKMEETVEKTPETKGVRSSLMDLWLQTPAHSLASPRQEATPKAGSESETAVSMQPKTPISTVIQGKGSPNPHTRSPGSDSGSEYGSGTQRSVDATPPKREPRAAHILSLIAGSGSMSSPEDDPVTDPRSLRTTSSPNPKNVSALSAPSESELRHHVMETVAVTQSPPLAPPQAPKSSSLFGSATVVAASSEQEIIKPVFWTDTLKRAMGPSPSSSQSSPKKTKTEEPLPDPVTGPEGASMSDSEFDALMQDVFTPPGFGSQAPTFVKPSPKPSPQQPKKASAGDASMPEVPPPPPVLSQTAPQTVLSQSMSQSSDDEFDLLMENLSGSAFLTPSQNSPKQQQRMQTERPKKFDRHLVLETMNTYYEGEDGLRRPQTVLRLYQEATHKENYAYLRQDWCELVVDVGDNVHIIGEFTDTKQSQNSPGCIIDNDANFLILNPDCLVSGTVIADSFYCPRKTLISEKFKSMRPASSAMVEGNIVSMNWLCGGLFASAP